MRKKSGELSFLTNKIYFECLSKTELNKLLTSFLKSCQMKYRYRDYFSHKLTKIVKKLLSFTCIHNSF